MSSSFESFGNYLRKHLWFIPAYYLVFQTMVMSFSYFYSVLTETEANAVVFLYDVRNITLFLSILMLLSTLRVHIDSVILTVLLWGSYGMTALLFPENMVYVKPLQTILLYGNFCYILFRSKLVPTDKLIKLYIQTSRLLCIMIPLSLFHVKHFAYYINNNYMTFSNALIYPLAFLCFSLFMKFNWIDFLLVGVDFAVVVLYGARGAFILLGLFIVFLLWFKTEKKVWLVLGGLVGIFLILLAASGDSPLQSGTSRTLEKLLSGELFSNHRANLWMFLIQKSAADLFLGGGLCADRVYLPEAFVKTDASFAHNLLIEWLVDFGFLGVLLFLAISIFLLHTFFTLKDMNKKVFFCIFLFFSYLNLMMSRSWISEPGFFMLLAVAVTFSIQEISTKNTLSRKEVKDE